MNVVYREVPEDVTDSSYKSYQPIAPPIPKPKDEKKTLISRLDRI